MTLSVMPSLSQDWSQCTQASQIQVQALPALDPNAQNDDDIIAFIDAYQHNRAQAAAITQACSGPAEGDLNNLEKLQQGIRNLIPFV